MKVVIGWILFNVSLILMFILTIINFFIVRDKNYFRDTAISLDRFGNREFRTFFNKALITKDGYKFGNPLQTISAVLGFNEASNTYTKLGGFIIKLLNFLDKNHRKNAMLKSQ